MKATLRPRDLAKIMADIRKVRELAKHRWYIDYVPVPKDPARTDKLVVGRLEKRLLKPRRGPSYLPFAQMDGKTYMH